MIRDFSQSTVTDLYGVIQSIRHDGQWGITDFFTDWFDEIPDTSDIDAYQRAVLDKFDIGESGLDTILSSVESVDVSFRDQLNADADTVTALADRIRLMAGLINPAAMSCSSPEFAALDAAVTDRYVTAANNAEADAEASAGATDQMLDDSQAWYEKLLNGVIGAGVGAVGTVVIGPVGDLLGLVDQAFGGGGHSKEVVVNLWGQVQTHILDNPETNEQWYFGGKTVGDTLGVGAGVVTTAAGLATVVSGVGLGVGGSVATATGVGAIAGVPALGVAVATVAEGAAMIGAGVSMATNGIDNAKADFAASSSASERANLDDPTTRLLEDKTLTDVHDHGRMKNYESDITGADQARKDFESLNPSNIRLAKNGETIIGDLADGKTIDLHFSTSLGGTPTLGIYDPITGIRTKVRY